MKTPTLEEVKEYFKNAKEFLSLGKTKFNYSEIKHFEQENGDVWVILKNKDYALLYDYKTNKYADVISYIEPTTEVRNSVLLQLADNNSYSEEILKKECPKLFIPTDIITIVEKYGKDKVISLIEKM